MAYRIYTEVNYADTSRDPDVIRTKEVAYKNELEDAKNVADDYIKKHFFHKNSKLVKAKNGDFQVTDPCSYGETIYIKKIKID